MQISAINNSQSFSGEKKKKVDYEKTNVFKIAGASLGAVGGVGYTAVTAFHDPYIAANKGKLVLLGALFALVGAASGALCGSLSDFVINKTVKNVVLSLKKDDNAEVKKA